MFNLACLLQHFFERMETEVDNVQLTSREVWRKEMRKSFCKKDMIDDNGNLVKEYIESDCSSFYRYFHLKRLKTWTMDEENLLIKGIQMYGVGEWERIRRDFLPDWVYYSFGGED